MKVTYYILMFLCLTLTSCGTEVGNGFKLPWTTGGTNGGDKKQAARQGVEAQNDNAPAPVSTASGGSTFQSQIAWQTLFNSCASPLYAMDGSYTHTLASITVESKKVTLKDSGKEAVYAYDLAGEKISSITLVSGIDFKITLATNCTTATTGATSTTTINSDTIEWSVNNDKTVSTIKINQNELKKTGN